MHVAPTASSRGHGPDAPAHPITLSMGIWGSALDASFPHSSLFLPVERDCSLNREKQI